MTVDARLLRAIPVVLAAASLLGCSAQNVATRSSTSNSNGAIGTPLTMTVITDSSSGKVLSCFFVCTALLSITNETNQPQEVDSGIFVTLDDGTVYSSEYSSALATVDRVSAYLQPGETALLPLAFPIPDRASVTEIFLAADPSAPRVAQFSFRETVSYASWPSPNPAPMQPEAVSGGQDDPPVADPPEQPPTSDGAESIFPPG